MFDIGFVELLICAVIALLVLGPERLPVAARATGRWIGKARRMASSFTSELDRQLKAEELREKIRKESSDLGAEEIQRNFQEGLAQAKKYSEYVVTEDQVLGKDKAPARPVTESPVVGNAAQSNQPGTAEPQTADPEAPAKSQEPPLR
ncbi:Sec-independent protein translocase protein TatB [Hydrocarboniclastica marina]|uniref:Sec-independent protein translocase protein TatB n=1 Tax=Hydrocarboniclastica marina TaxID=2259620 RepID=A0A4P7XKU3_9ALTE|nr:Sec-independent protein translocase protein TatB [Hydrocarboniclastica marina]MAL99997.1 twin-arginine translocase subunit TatB [Alteromonadaceae bacterium]QCF26962.1 twin-arginine translocase subunit TatB [Hydrocarboniclastica marina]